MHAPLRACCLLGLVTWAASHGIEPPPRPSADHLEWLRLEHARYAHRLLRVLRRLEATADAHAEGDVGGGGEGCAARQPQERLRVYMCMYVYVYACYVWNGCIAALAYVYVYVCV